MPPRRKRPSHRGPPPAELVAWYRRHRRDLPWRRSSDPYAIWIAEIMLQQTTVQAVLPYYDRFLRRFPDPVSLARARLASVLAAWSGLGYYRRARHLHAAARRIRHLHKGRFPSRFEEILALPGVGRYTAGAIASIAFGQQRPILDGNVARVLSRHLGLEGDPRAATNTRRLWSAATSLVEASTAPGDLNQALMELGATLCTPSTPDCDRCPLALCCVARRAGRQGEIPPPRRRRKQITVPLRLALIERRGRVLLRRRDGTALMDGLWELPPLDRRSQLAGGSDRIGEGDLLAVERLEPFATFRHSITHRQLEVEVQRANLLAEPRGKAYRWVTPAQAGRLPTSSIVSKALRKLQDDREE
jgi:A/G-specific adenine glycosylase